MKRALGVLVLSVFVLSHAGCGGSKFEDPVSVTGVVKLEGEPVEGATVTFLAKEGAGRSATGKTDAQGSFSLTTFSTGDGAIPGDYMITISKVESEVSADDVDVASGDDPGEAYGQLMDAASSEGGLAELQEDVLPEKYADAGESGLTRSVVAGDKNHFEFDLE